MTPPETTARRPKPGAPSKPNASTSGPPRKPRSRKPRGDAEAPKPLQNLESDDAGTRRVRWACTLATAILWWLAVSRAWGFPLGWVALAPLLWSARDLNPRRALGYGWRGGFAGYFLVNWWIIPTITIAAPTIGLPSVAGTPLGVFAVSFIAAVHGFQAAISLAVAQRARAWRGPWAFVLTFAILWGVCDWLRTLGPLAHGWGALAFSQWRDLPMLQNVRWMGQHGLSAWCAGSAACLALAWEFRARDAHPGASTWWHRVPASWKFAGASIGSLVLLHALGAARLASNPPRAAGAGRSLKVLLVQTNIPSGPTKYEPAVRAALRLSDAHLSLHPNAKKPDVAIWPETTLSGQLVRPFNSRFQAAADGRVDGTEAREVQRWAQNRGVPVLVGSLLRTRGSGGQSVNRNDAAWFATDGSVQRRGKTRAVPFGERAPFSEWLPFLEKFAPKPMIEVAQVQGPLSVRMAGGREMKIGTVICFESAFPRPALDAARGAEAMFVLTNDEWFGRTEAPTQHAAMGVVRAVECNVPLAQASNGGRSFAVDRLGRFVLQNSSPQGPLDGLAPIGVETVVEATLPLD